jgi:hypothetical protein
MIVKCIYKTGDALRKFEYKSLDYSILGRFGSTGFSEYNELSIGKEYIVLGIIIFETYQGYLLDDNGLIFVSPCQLFEIIDDKLNSNWHYRLIENTEDIYPYIQAMFGYYELCFDKKSYEKLIIENDVETQKNYYKRKVEFEKI